MATATVKPLAGASTLDSSEADQPPKKKLRKGTRSCWNCKHRKVRCDFVEGESNCRECIARGSTCRSQDLPEPQDSERSSLNERVGRVEQLLERTLEKIEGLDGISRSDDRRGCAVSHALTPSSMKSYAPENAPLLSLFDNSATGRRERDLSPDLTTPRHDGVPETSLEKLRRAFFALLPTQATIEKLAEANSVWWLLRVHMCNDDRSELFQIPSEHLGRSHPITIANALLWIAIILQHIPSDFDVRSTGLKDPERFTQQAITLIATSLARDENLVCHNEGIECLVLQGIFYNNAGQLRSAWLCYRRAMNIAQLMGFHRPLTNWSPSSGPRCKARALALWRHIIQTDRSLALTLDVHYGIGDAAYHRDENSVTTTTEDQYSGKLFEIAGRLIDRNQMSPTVSPEMVRATQAVDIELTSLSLQVPATWWNLPQKLPFGKTEECAALTNRLIVQLWHSHIEALVHIPLMIKAASDRRYEQNRRNCLRASLDVVNRYTTLKQGMRQNVWKSLDFQAFTAAVTLMVNSLGTISENPICEDSTCKHSLGAVNRVIETLESSSKDRVVAQALSVLTTLKEYAFNGKSIGEGRQIKLTIPYFGTIFLEGNKPVARQETATTPKNAMLSNGGFSMSYEASTTTPGDGSIPGYDIQPSSAQPQPTGTFPFWNTNAEQMFEDWMLDGHDTFGTQSEFVSDWNAAWLPNC